MLRPRLGLGLRPPGDGDSALLASIVNNANYTASVAGTNVATTRATSLLCPFGGVSLSNNVPCKRRVYLSGKAHDAFGAWPQTQNIATYSSDLTNAAWTKTRCDIPATFYSAPNGANTAQKLREDSTSSSTHDLSRSIGSAAVHTVSVRAKPDGRNWIVLHTNGVNTYFNVSSGVIGTIGIGHTPSIQKLNDGWFLCSVTYTFTAAHFVAFRLATGDGVDSYSGDGTSGVLLWGPQITTGSVVLPYAETASSPVTVNPDRHTMTVSTDQIGAILACVVPIYWSIGAGAIHPSGLTARILMDNVSSGHYLFRYNTDFTAKDDVASQSVSVSGLAMSASVPQTRFSVWDSTKLELWRNGVLAGSDVSLSGPWVSKTGFLIGNVFALNRAWYGLVLVGVCNGFIPSAAAMGAWHRSVVKALQPLSVPII